MRKFMLTVIPIILVVCVACEPPQIPSTVHLEGDSVTFQTYYTQPVPAFHTSGEFVPGSSAAYNPAGVAAKDRVPEMVTQGKVDTLIWALGPNDIRMAGGQWSSTDQWIWYDVLANKVPEESCIVIVKPWVLEGGWDVFPEQALNDLSAWIDVFAASHPNVVVEDWKPIIEAHPEYMAADGVHIATYEAAVARDALYREGVARCA